MGHLIHRVKTAKGRSYPTWLWRTTSRNPDDWREVRSHDVEIGRYLGSIRTRVMVAIGEISVVDLMTSYVRFRLEPMIKAGAMGTFTGIKDHQKNIAWWVSIPARDTAAAKVAVTFRSQRGSGWDLRRKDWRDQARAMELEATELWRTLADDPILHLAECRWLEAEAEREAETCRERLIEIRREWKRGDLSQRDYEADERSLQLCLDGWEGVASTVRSRWDEQEKAIRSSLPRTTRDALMTRVIARSERLQSDPKQLSAWRADHWADGVLSY
jgi:hypothetical protein